METTDVIICGCGPTGAMLRASLGRLGVKSICIEKASGITTDPRGIALDEDGIRALQSVGIYDKIFTEMGICMGVFHFVGGVHSDLHHPPFMGMDYTTSEGGTGHVGFLCHKQPELEQQLQNASLTNADCELRESCTLTKITEDDDWIYATYLNEGGEEQVLRGKFLVGCDGKTGFTRKKYLEPKGILMQQASETSYAETWVAVNWRLSLPTPTTHPDFPLWKLGYSPEDVFDAFFPVNFRFLCNPNRAAVCGRFGPPAEHLWRFEFVVKPDEDGNEMATPEALERVVYPYLTHAGSRYGLDKDVLFPPDCIETLRSRPFFFAARSCNKWSLGRAILCGDSAHVFPPFGGQGLASGFRDANALAWRLKVACQDGVRAYDQLFEGWYGERKQQLERSLAATVENGKYVTEGNPIKIMVRDFYMQFCQLIPSWKRQLEQGARRFGMCQYNFREGMHFLPGYSGGLLFPQVYCMPLASSSHVKQTAGVCFTDDLIFDQAKKGLFQLVVVISSAAEISTVRKELDAMKENDSEYLRSTEATVIIMDNTAALPDIADVRLDIARVAVAKEFAASTLCLGRPEPKYYDEYRMAKELPDKRYIILRPDRFVFAACKDSEELTDAWKQIKAVLNVSQT